MAELKSLKQCRDEIDELDEQIIALFEKRMAVAKNVIEYKIAHNLEIFQPEREQQVLQKNLNRVQNEDLLPFAASFVQEMMTVSKSYQSELLPYPNEVKYNTKFKEDPMIGYQGVKGAFSQQALRKFFEEDTRNIGYPEFEDVFIALENGDIDYGVLPIENSLTGSINDNYDLIRNYGFYIVGETAIPVAQCLMGLPGTKIEDIKEVYSHPQGLAQCSDFIYSHKDMEAMPYKDTAMAAEFVARTNDKTKAAIASPLAAEIYGLEIIGHSIQNDKSNMTRFMVISKELIVPENSDKTSVMFKLPHKVGSLYNILDIIKQHDINLVRIESRPMKTENWQYYFYIDFDGNLREERIRKAVMKMKTNSIDFKILGNYKKA